MKLLVALASSVFCVAAAADQHYLTASLKCDPAKPKLVVSFHSSWNEAGEEILSRLGPNDFNPLEFVTFSQNEAGKYSISTRSERKVCRMNGRKYIVEFSPLMAQRFHPEGFCATRIGAKVSIRLDGRVLASAGVDACTEEGMITKTISLSPSGKPLYEKINVEQFYGE